jgi:hypothetical protein
MDKWIELTDNKIKKDDICIEKSLIGLLKEDEYEGWIIRECDVADYYDYYPIQTGCNGIRFHAIYVNINKKSPKHGKLYRLTSFVTGDVDFSEETYYFKDYAHKCNI